MGTTFAPLPYICPAMPHILLLSASVRTGRRSHRVALFLERFISASGRATVGTVDLAALDFPIFHERYTHMTDPPPALRRYAEKIGRADAVVIVTPEYNGGYPAALKNAMDVLVDEWQRKPVAFATVSDGAFGGTQVITALQFSFWKLRAWTVPARFPVPNVAQAFDPDGVPADPGTWEKHAASLLNEILWCVEARARMKDHPG